MNLVGPCFFFWTVWSSVSVSRRSVREHAEPSGSDCVARMRRRLRSFGVAERSERKKEGWRRGRAPLRFPAPSRMGMAGHVPLSGSVPEGPSAAWRRTCCRGGCTRADAATPRDARSEAEGPSPPARPAPGRVGSGGFGAGHPQGFDAPADGSVKTDRPLRSPWSDCGCRIRRHQIGRASCRERV